MKMRVWDVQHHSSNVPKTNLVKKNEHLIQIKGNVLDVRVGTKVLMGDYVGLEWEKRNFWWTGIAEQASVPHMLVCY